MFIIHEADPIVGVGGPQDSLMDHDDKNGTHKFRKKCTLPLTGSNVVDMIITNFAVFERSDRCARFRLTSLAPGVTTEYVRERTVADYAEDLVEADYRVL